MLLSRKGYVETSAPVAEWNRRSKIIAVGLGDSILQDHGVGIHAIRRFHHLTPRPCLAVEIGTSVADATHLFENADRILAFDAIEAGEQPGSVYVLRAEDTLIERKNRSLHEIKLIGALQTLRNPPAEVVIIAAEPQIFGWGTELSPALDSAVSIMVSTARDVIAKWQSLDLNRERIDLARIIQDSKYKYRECISHFEPA
jgi:hydrogenase maturation protease